MQHYGDYVLAVEVMYRYGLEQLIGLIGSEFNLKARKSAMWNSGC